MNKKAKKRIFDAVMARSPAHCQNPKYEQMIKKLILMKTSYKHRRYVRTWTEEEMIKTMTSYKKQFHSYNATPEELAENIRLEESVGLMCGVSNK